RGMSEQEGRGGGVFRRTMDLADGDNGVMLESSKHRAGKLTSITLRAALFFRFGTLPGPGCSRAGHCYSSGPRDRHEPPPSQPTAFHAPPLQTASMAAFMLMLLGVAR